MDFIDLQMALIVALILTATAIVVFFDHRVRRRRQLQPQRIKSHIHSVARRPRTVQVFDTAPFAYGPAKKLAAQRPLEPLVGIATRSRPPVQLRERETVTVELASAAPVTASGSTETQLSTAVTLPTVALPAFTIDAELWERLISSQSNQNLLSSADSVEPATPTLGSTFSVVAAYHTVQEGGLDVAPAQQTGGMIQQPALDELLENEERFTGLVVCIGINDSDSSMWHSQGLVQSVGTYIASLLREKDFSCRTSYDEFVMVCRGEQGAESQRRLNQISERLWDYQLRGIGACSVLFSWGGVQVQDQPLAEAIASATERMRETKRSGIAAESALAHRQAV
jgi:hypothetical protein